MKELIELAKEKGFESTLEYSVNDLGGYIDFDNPTKDPFVYLWMCELWKWLRDKHLIFINIDYWFHDEIPDTFHIYCNIYDMRAETGKYIEVYKEDNSLYVSTEEALINGLTEALHISL